MNNMKTATLIGVDYVGKKRQYVKSYITIEKRGRMLCGGFLVHFQ